MYNTSDPYADPIRRRFQQPQADLPVPAYQPPPPMMAQPPPVTPGPQMPMQMIPMGDQSQQQQQMDTGVAGLGELIKRFKPMGGASAAGGAKGGMSMGGFEGKV